MSASRSPGADRRRRSHSEAGQSLVELAMVLPILLGLLIGILEFGRAWNVRQVAVHAAREGARMAILATSQEADVRAGIEANLGRAGLDPALGQITIAGMENDFGDPVTVEVLYPFTFTYLGPLLAFIDPADGGQPPGTVILEGHIVMLHE